MDGMDIEDIINKVRFTSPEDKKARSRSLWESTDTSTVSESRSTPKTISSYLEAFKSNKYATYNSDVSPSDPFIQQTQAHVQEDVRHWTKAPPGRRRARLTSENYDSRQLSKPWSHQQPLQQMNPIPHGHATQAMYYPAYMAVPMPMPPAIHTITPQGNFSMLQRQYHLPEQSHWICKEEENQPSRPHPRGLRLPPLPEPLRRAQSTSKRKPRQPKQKRKRIRAPAVVREYSHLSVDEAIQELARRNIRITDMQQFDISMPRLVKLLQRADRNNNRGSGNASDCERTTTPA